MFGSAVGDLPTDLPWINRGPAGVGRSATRRGAVSLRQDSGTSLAWVGIIQHANSVHRAPEYRPGYRRVEVASEVLKARIRPASRISLNRPVFPTVLVLIHLRRANVRPAPRVSAATPPETRNSYGPPIPLVGPAVSHWCLPGSVGTRADGSAG